MLVWKGWGIVVPLVYVGVVIAAREASRAAGISDNIAIWAGVILSAVLVWFAGRKLNDPSKAKRVFDAETGQEMLLCDTHTFFWIKAEYWAFIIPLILGAIFLING
ncbi:hypothetical protein HRM2_04160 [Desulforapulum autotrophicum HRM2]|uniref:Uncharacterized protein n=1 Tax=Desulforapulum autotrophicum (strain ATCC 43914 / DSM 3382 / VKM B-1955 / HRM2) TaxID=177437 RepID=C0QGQ9_DESAH|nr:hypothetical protein [Desulforapulum autotrophicum]ACN13534.1 hypothetical protein HRM2_04160 [Desulforapulum autotrophicum HRM2]